MDEVFHLKAPFQPTGDQPQAIEALMQGIHEGDDAQTLLGVTGSGKTFTKANIIARCNRPTLILEPNKTLASQICTEMRGFFPDDAVEYFVSYYDYYQPEAYIPSTDTYIEKDSAINDEIDRLRHSATAALSERRNVIIVASVSCIYSLGDPIDYRSMVISLRPGMQMERDELCSRLVKLQYERNDMNFIRNKFRVKGDTVDIHLAYNDAFAIRVEFLGDEIDRIVEFDPLTGEHKNVVRHVAIFPASHYIVGPEKMQEGLKKIQAEMEEQVKKFTEEGKLLEAQRIQQRAHLLGAVHLHPLPQIALDGVEHQPRRAVPPAQGGKLLVAHAVTGTILKIQPVKVCPHGLGAGTQHLVGVVLGGKLEHRGGGLRRGVRRKGSAPGKPGAHIPRKAGLARS